ncbi:unnamed protein product [Symbiodinium natans]|uniref:Methyltransferase domain-containing protein n=1 Tax=Symbiodinium natans TaxID=878477 RepID=A0A812LZS8_9DINO|nr:unnamed protein product [Symbiodinium natans]
MLRRAFFCSHVVSVSGVLYNCLVDFDCFESPDEEELCAKSLAPSDCCRAALLVKQVRRLGESWKTGREPGANETCSDLSVSRRYPLEYDSYVVWDYVFRYVFDKFTVYQRRQNRRLKELLAHTRKCRSLGVESPLYNPFEPDRCLEEHPVMRSWVQFRDTWNFTHSQHLTAARVDWLGITVDCADGTLESLQFSFTRFLECLGIPWGPLPGEDYFETITLLQSVAESGDSFVAVEAGSGRGYWAVKAAKAYKRQHPSGACSIVLIESEEDMKLAAAHLTDNGVFSICNATLYASYATPSLLDSVIRGHGRVDLLHVDIQRAELPLFQGSQLLRSVRRVHVGTHSRLIHRHLRVWLQLLGFQLDFDLSPLSFVRSAFGPIPTNDGLLAAHRHGERESEV